MAKAASKSWRDVLPIHPAAEMFPRMSKNELLALGEDIKRHGLREGIALYNDVLLDGINRLDAMEAVGTNLITGNGEINWALLSPLDVRNIDPYEYVVSANLHRRHLTTEQKRELVEKLVKATPEKSDRQIAETTKTSPTTVGKVRKVILLWADFRFCAIADLHGSAC